MNTTTTQQNWTAFCTVKTLTVLLSFFFLFLFINSIKAQVAGDFRSAVSGQWDNPTTWQRYNGTGWDGSGFGSNNPGQTPGATSSVYIQTGHTVTLVQDESCRDLHLNNTTAQNRLAIGGTH